MEAIKMHTVIKKNGELKVTGTTFKKGQEVEMIILLEQPVAQAKQKGTAGYLLKSEIVGIWKDRKDIVDSSSYALKLREKAQNRNINS